jgi:hypothetical protein
VHELDEFVASLDERTTGGRFVRGSDSEAEMRKDA